MNAYSEVVLEIDFPRERRELGAYRIGSATSGPTSDGLVPMRSVSLPVCGAPDSESEGAWAGLW
jgi:hypothetical protein